ncbi:MAG: hypothetical protein K6F64_00300 [Clostridia bacterium]|nr:hypothetical protein [Clostridia bacterium]
MSEGVITSCIGGCENRKFDQGNRITIPNAFRERFQAKQVYLLKNIQSRSKANNCIIAYTPEEYLAFYERLETIFEGEMLDKAQRKIAGSTDRAIIDKDGRISLKPDFMEFAQLTDEAVISCQPKKIEIWNPEKWSALQVFDEQTETDEGEQPDFSRVQF